MSESKDEKSVFEAGRSTIQTVTTAPRLARLSVSLVIDESLDAGRRRAALQERTAKPVPRPTATPTTVPTEIP